MILCGDTADNGGGGVAAGGGCPPGRTLDGGKGGWGGTSINM